MSPDNRFHFGPIVYRCSEAEMTSSFVTADAELVNCQTCRNLMVRDVTRSLLAVGDGSGPCLDCKGVGWWGDEVKWANMCGRCEGTGVEPSA